MLEYTPKRMRCCSRSLVHGQVHIGDFWRGGSQYQSGLGLLVHQEWQEFQTQVNHTGEIDIKLSMETRQIDFCRLCQVHWMLLAGIENNAIKIWVFGGDSILLVRADCLDC